MIDSGGILKPENGGLGALSPELRHLHERETTVKLLQLFNEQTDVRELVRGLTGLLQEWTGCEAVGVRLREGDDFPYYETRGLDAEFVQLENLLCATDVNGNIVCDNNGCPVLECACGNVLNGRFDPSWPFCTPKGSFWTNSTSELVAILPEVMHRPHARNRCIEAGYESVALIPLRSGGQTLGLLQFNDRAKGRFTPDLLAFLENVADQFAIALAQRQAQAASRESEEHYRSLFANMINGFAYCKMLFDEQGKPDDFVYVEVNASFEALTGLNDVAGRKVSEVIPGFRESDREMIENYGRVAETGIPERFERWVEALKMWFYVSVYSPRKGYFVAVFDVITERKQAEHDLLASETRFRRLFESGKDGILILDAGTGQIVDVNPFLIRLLGFDKEYFLNKRLWEIGVFRDIAASKTAFTELLEKEYVRYEDLPLLTRDGRQIQVEFVSNVYLVDSTRVIQCNIRDITERKRAEEELSRLNRALQILSECNEILVRATDETELLDRVCRAIVEIGGYGLAWVGFSEAGDLKPVRPLAWSATEPGYLENIRVTWDQSAHGRGPAGTAIRTGQVVFIRDTRTAPDFEPWREAAIKHGYLSAIALPLKASGRVFGALLIYARELNAFDDDEAELLMEMADDLAFGIAALRTQAERDLARKELEVLARFPEENPNPVLRIDANGTLLYANAAAAPILTHEGMEAGHLVPDKWRTWMEESLGARHNKEIELGCEGEIYFLAFAPIAESGYVNVYGRDITEHKRAEQALRESESLYRELVQNANSAIIRWKRDGTITFFNEYAQALFGYTADEALGKSVGILVPETESTGADLSTLIQDIVKHPEQYLNNVNENICRNGRRVWMTWTNKPIFDAEGQVEEILTVGSDITESKRAEEALRESERRFRSLAVATSQIIWSTDGQGQVSGPMPSFQAYTGQSDEEIKGSGWASALHPEDVERTTAVWSSAVENRTGYETEYRLRKSDGEYRHFAARGAPVISDEGAIVEWIGTCTDITERKRVAEVVRMTLDRLQQFIDANIIGVLIANAAGDVFEANDYYLNLIGFTQDDLDAGNVDWRAITPPEWLPADEKAIRELRERGKCVPYEKEYLRRDGTRVSVLLADALLLGPKEQIAAFALDLTERKRAEEQIRFQNAVLTTQQEASLDGILVVDYQGRIVSHNQRYVEMMRIPPEVLQSDEDAPLLKFVMHQMADPDAFLARVLYLYEHPEEKSREEIALADGRIFDRYSATMFGPDGQNYGRVWYFRDITERKRAEEQLRKLSMAVEQSPASVVITDLQGDIEYVNPKFTEVTGYALEEVRGRNPRVLKSGEMPPEGYRTLWETITSGGAWRGEFHNKKKDGTLFWEQAFISPVRDEAGTITHFLGIKEDVTRQKSLDEQYRQAQKMEVIGQLAGGVAHDFNNILQTIMGYSQMLLDRLPEQEVTHEFAEEIERGAERAAKLTRQLLAFSRRQVLEMANLNLNDIVENVLKMISRLLGEDIRLHVVRGSELGAVHADPGQIEQVLMNLCINARDAMPEGGIITIETTNVEMDSEYCVAHAWATVGQYVLLSITDTGCGMDAPTQERIFEPFFTTKELGKGTGLGLATVYGIVRQHQGMIQVYSEVGKGTTFKVYLPSFERRTTTVDPKVIERPRGGTETILVAEDDESLRKLAARILEGARYTVLLADNGEEALDIFEKHAEDIDLCLLDVVMPKLGGKAVYDFLRERHPRLRFLFSSGYSTNAIHTGFVLKEGIELIQKPYAPDALLRKVREVLDKIDVSPISESDQGQEENPE